jgi:hypothetical protein
MFRKSSYTTPYSTPDAAFGAREITSFNGRAANDNRAIDGTTAGPRRSGIGLPAIAFFCGLGAATMVTLAQHFLRSTG